MNLKTLLSVVGFLLLVVGIFYGISCLKNNTNNDLVIIGKAPNFSLTNQHGKNTNNDTYKGKIYVVDFFFTTCPSICPVMTQNMKQIQDAFADNSIGIASFSINPEHDTPEILSEYAQKHGATNPNWHFLTGDSEEILALSNNGFNIYAGAGTIEDGGFEHSGLFALIDQNGNIVSRKNKKGNPIIYYNGLTQEGIDMLIQDIQILKNQ